MAGETVGDRVLVLKSASKDKREAYVYGEGTYVGNLAPPLGTKTPFGDVDESILAAGFKNPCIKLDDGRIVWGCQCWWGHPNSVRKQLAGYTEVLVDVGELANPPLPE